MTSSKMPFLLREIFFKEPQTTQIAQQTQAFCRLDRVLVMQEQYEDPVVHRTSLLTFQRGDISPADLSHEMGLAILNDVEVMNDEMCRDIAKIHSHHIEQLSSDELEIASPYLQDNTDVSTSYNLTMDDGTVYKLYKAKGNLLNVQAPHVERCIDLALRPLNLPKAPEAGPRL